MYSVKQIILSSLCITPFILGGGPAIAASCAGATFLYEHRDRVMEIEDPAKRSDYIRKAVASGWSTGSDTAAKTLMAYGMGEGLATAPSRAMAERALALGHEEMLKLAKAAPYDQERIIKTLSKVKQGAMATDELNVWMDRVGVAVDAINLLDWSIEALQTGDQYAHAKAAQSLLSLGRTATGKIVGGSMGAMMASASFLDYAITSFGDAAHEAYDKAWYGAYQEYYDGGGRDGAYWIALRERGGDEAVAAELAKFWDDPFGYANLQSEDVDLPFIGDGLAIAQKQQVYADRYMKERIEPKVAAETRRRAETAFEHAQNAYEEACDAAESRARTLQAVDTLFAELDAGSLEEQLLAAVQSRDTAKVEELLHAGADPYKPDDDSFSAFERATVRAFVNPNARPVLDVFLNYGLPPGKAFEGMQQTPMTLAVNKKKLDVLVYLLDRGFSPNQPNADGHTPLILAAYKGHLEIARTLLDSGVAIEATGPSGMTALAHAANGGHADVASLLMSRGAEINKVGSIGYSPLIVAAARGHMNAVKVLIDGGADPELRGKSGTAEDYARNKGHDEIAEYLASLSGHRGPLEVEASTYVGVAIPARMETDDFSSLEFRVKGQVTPPLDWRIFIDDTEVLGWRPREGSEPDMFTFQLLAKAEGTSEFGVRVTDANGNKGRWSKTVQVKISYRGLVEELKSAITNSDGDTFVRLSRDPRAADIMQRECVNLNRQNLYCRMFLGGAALVNAASRGNENMLRAVLDAGVDPDARFYASEGWHIGFSPMTYAMAAGETATAQMLINAGANIHHKNPDGSNALVWALAAGREDIALNLIERGIDVNAMFRKDGRVMSPLHIAAMNEDRALMDVLMRSGGRVTRDDAGHTPGYYAYWLMRDVDLAVELGYDEAREYERKANEPDFDWNEFARRMQPVVGQFQQNVAAIQRQGQQRRAEINRNLEQKKRDMYASISRKSASTYSQRQSANVQKPVNTRSSTQNQENWSKPEETSDSNGTGPCAIYVHFAVHGSDGVRQPKEYIERLDAEAKNRPGCVRELRGRIHEKWHHFLKNMNGATVAATFCDVSLNVYDPNKLRNSQRKATASSSQGNTVKVRVQEALDGPTIAECTY